MRRTTVVTILGRKYKRMKVKGHYMKVARNPDGTFKKVKKWSSKKRRWVETWRKKREQHEILISIISSKGRKSNVLESPTILRDGSESTRELENASHICMYIHIPCRERPLWNVRRNIRISILCVHLTWNFFQTLRQRNRSYASMFPSVSPL